ncbi:MAG: Endolytic peptidoglycan transglycosylase RlpA [Gammaproteobacteria bacterium]|nr:Endolytic peptidoglycan transglycosylase RlpA [Gammaproteobacteria bacterium]
MGYDLSNRLIPAERLLCTAIFLLVFTLMQGCSVTSTRTDGRPAQPVDVSTVPDAAPKNEPKSKYGNPASYVVNGKTYYVMKDSANFVERGIASWYGTKFHGRRTSSGETYDMYAMTAAHKTLPLPTYVSVRNLDNGHSIVVKVNDRGPFHENRVVDLSYVAALKLGIVNDGTGLVEVRAINQGNYRVEPVQVSGQAAINNSGKGFYVQVGAFSNYENAQQFAKKLTGLADNLIQISETTVRNGKLYRVRFGPITDIDVADRIVINLARYGIDEHRIVVDL